MKNIYTAAGVVLIGAAAALTGATSATASPTSGYHGDAPFTTVLWSAQPNLDGSTPWPQHYVEQAPGDNQYLYGLGTAGLTCGTFYQADVYHTRDVPGITADNTLNQGEDNGKALKWTTFTTPACQVATPPTTPPVTTTPQPTDSPTPPVDTSAPTPPTTPPATIPPVVTPTPTASPTPPITPPASPGPTSTATPAPTVPPTAPPTANAQPVGTLKPTPRTADRSDASTHRATSLAYTGSDVNKPLLIGSATLVTGLILLFGARALRIRKTRQAGRTK